MFTTVIPAGILVVVAYLVFAAVRRAWRIARRAARS
jgi:hypothetical protein